MISVEAHLDAILTAVVPLPAVTLATVDALGRTLAADAHAETDLPPFDNSSMDGFAVKYADVADASPSTPTHLRVVADLPAGSPADPPLRTGEAIRIMTGAPLPTAADTIIPFEDTAGGLADSLDSIAVTRHPRSAGAFVRRRGDDTRDGDVVLSAGTPLGALQLGALTAAGIARIAVTRPPRVAVISTGDELVPAGSPLTRGQIPESNGILLASLATECGAEVTRCALVDDEGSALSHLLDNLTRGDDAVDVIIFSGGVSAGAYEVVRQTVTEMQFSRVAMQPGKPQGFGTSRHTLLFGLPGNPVSSAVSFEVFVRPALLTMQRRTAWARPVARLRTTAGWRTPPGRRQYLPVVIDRSDSAAWRVAPASSGGSHLAAKLGAAEGYAVVPAEIDVVDAGDLVDVLLLN